MSMRLGDDKVPFPLFTIKGKLRLSGLDDQAISDVLQDVVVKKFDTRDGLITHVFNSLKSYDSTVQTNFNALIRYESARRRKHDIPAIILVIEGASGTGKSLIALELMRDLVATRFISTDSVRVVLRGIMSEEKYPELFCHTYQAHVRKQTGPEDLDPVVRGFLAQCDIITPTIEAMMRRVVGEGANAVVEGVHIIPGVFQQLGSGVIEVLLDPDPEIHKAMFAGKYSLEKLTTVSSDMSIREKEFEAARAIQDFMRVKANDAGTAVVPLHDYDEARKMISSHIISRIEGLLKRE